MSYTYPVPRLCFGASEVRRQRSRTETRYQNVVQYFIQTNCLSRLGLHQCQGGLLNCRTRGSPIVSFVRHFQNSMLSIKVIPPRFRVLSRGNLVLDSSKKGRILLEWSPRAEGGTSLYSVSRCFFGVLITLEAAAVSSIFNFVFLLVSFLTYYKNRRYQP